MTSAEIIPEYMLENMPPLNKKRITGKLYLEGVKKIKINKKLFSNTLKKTYDSGSILDFEILDHKIILGIEWTNYPPRPRKSDFSTIEIEAEKIYWENVPNFFVSEPHGHVGRHVCATQNKFLRSFNDEVCLS